MRPLPIFAFCHFCNDPFSACSDEMSKGRFDAAISKVCFELLLETFNRILARDLGEKVEEVKGDGKLVC